MPQTQPIAIRAEFQVNGAQLEHSYCEFQVTFPVPFDDTKYTLVVTTSHSAVGSETGKNAYYNCGYRDKKPTGFLAVVGIIKENGPAVDDNILVDAIAIHD